MAGLQKQRRDVMDDWAAQEAVVSLAVLPIRLDTTRDQKHSTAKTLSGGR